MFSGSLPPAEQSYCGLSRVGLCWEVTLCRVTLLSSYSVQSWCTPGRVWLAGEGGTANLVYIKPELINLKGSRFHFSDSYGTDFWTGSIVLENTSILLIFFQFYQLLLCYRTLAKLNLFWTDHWRCLHGRGAIFIPSLVCQPLLPSAAFPALVTNTELTLTAAGS